MYPSGGGGVERAEKNEKKDTKLLFFADLGIALNLLKRFRGKKCQALNPRYCPRQTSAPCHREIGGTWRRREGGFQVIKLFENEFIAAAAVAVTAMAEGGGAAHKFVFMAFYIRGKRGSRGGGGGGATISPLSSLFFVHHRQSCINIKRGGARQRTQHGFSPPVFFPLENCCQFLPPSTLLID